ncbi:MAG: hypothetical protein P0116_10875, partial [Candidatus Nitrosocosmicus sp.]|nr:hypothetical protein [Candidatus Nitrosocosmicus sp.]
MPPPICIMEPMDANISTIMENLKAWVEAEMIGSIYLSSKHDHISITDQSVNKTVRIDIEKYNTIKEAEGIW